MQLQTSLASWSTTSAVVMLLQEMQCTLSCSSFKLGSLCRSTKTTSSEESVEGSIDFSVSTDGIRPFSCRLVHTVQT